MKRISVRIAGESGQGVNSIGEALMKSFKRLGLYTFGYREYPSLIKGGFAHFQVEVSSQPVSAPNQNCDVMICMSRRAFHHYYNQVDPHGYVVHDVTMLDVKPEEQEYFDAHDIHLEFVDAPQLAIESGGKKLMSNTVLVGVVWKMLDLDLKAAQKVIKDVFAKKPHYIDVNLACLKTGYQQELPAVAKIEVLAKRKPERANDMLISGNHALAIGAIAGGVRAYYAYPMTPSSSVLSYLAAVQHQTKMVVKQVDDEISAAQMTIGSMFAGTRALTGTSGGGFDLMTESVSLAGMTETPFVCILAQRPGPATGLPTWTGAGDLHLAVFGGHGEFPRIVVAASEPSSAYVIMQEALNLAEEFQTVVIVLTEKQIAESWYQIEDFPEPVPIKRGLVMSTDSLTADQRFKITKSGVSPRWIPGSSDAGYVANSDEHLEDGSLTEDAEPAKAMIDKRLRKMDGIVKKLPEPKLYGAKDAELTFVGWGSPKQSVLDAFSELDPKLVKRCNYLHYEYVWPLKTKKFLEVVEAAKQVVLIENNALGQLGTLISQQTGYQFSDRFLKYDGRPFFVEEVLAAIKERLK